MRRYAIPGLFLVGLIAIVYVLISAGIGKQDENPLARYATGALEKLDFATTGDPAGTAPFYLADGSAHTLDEFKGKTILVNFWATWCAPCEKEMPSLGALQKARGGDDFQVVAISVDAAEDKDYASSASVSLARPTSRSASSRRNSMSLSMTAAYRASRPASSMGRTVRKSPVSPARQTGPPSRRSVLSTPY